MLASEVTGWLAVPRLVISVCALVLTAGCASVGTTAPSVSSKPAPITVSSTLDGLSSLPLRIHWEAMPGVPDADVSEVDFLIDGKLAWVEYNSPYFYGDDGNWLVTSFLTPGEHTFTVRVLATSGQSASNTVHATTVGPSSPPPALAGTWVRAVTPADQQKATSGMPPPAGDWRVTIAAEGWEPTDPNGGGGLFDVAYPAAGVVEMRPTIEYPPFPNSNNGGICQDTDPIFDWTYLIGDGGRALTLRPDGQDPCGDRAAIYEGTWTRATQ